MQYTLTGGRVTSIDDVLLNTTGALAGAGLTRPWWRPRWQFESDDSAAKGAPER
ncbi:VanZ family protein [Streptomonospora alba]|uniref:VanZ family protein n=1 Tax=Streptomonospora alba TaxID=183763 RepID=UPI0012EE243F